MGYLEHVITRPFGEGLARTFLWTRLTLLSGSVGNGNEAFVDCAVLCCAALVCHIGTLHSLVTDSRLGYLEHCSFMPRRNPARQHQHGLRSVV